MWWCGAARVLLGQQQTEGGGENCFAKEKGGCGNSGSRGLVRGGRHSELGLPTDPEKAASSAQTLCLFCSYIGKGRGKKKDRIGSRVEGEP